MTTDEQDAVGGPLGMPPDGEDTRQLEGRMGVAELVFTVLAFNGPLAAVSGYLAFVIYFNGIGAPLVLAAAGVITLIFAVGFTTMSRYLPNPGAFYSYISAGLGKSVGLGGAFLAVYAYGLVLLGVYAFFGIVANQLVSSVWGGAEIGWYWYALAAWIVVSALSYFNIEISAKALLVALAAELVMVVVFDVAVFANGGPEGRSLEPFTLGAAGAQNVGIALLFAVSLFLGFEATAIFREEVKQPSKTVPRATYAAVLTIVVLFVLSSWLLIVAFGVSKAATVAQSDPASMFPTAMTQYVGPVGTDIVSVLLVSSVFAALLSITNVLARYLFSLGRDGVLPRALGRVHPRSASPHLAATAAAVAMLVGGVVFTAVGADPSTLYGRLAGVGGFAIIILELVTSISVVAFFRRSRQDADTTKWHTLVAPTIAALGLGLVIILAIANFTTLIGSSTSVAVVLQILTWGVIVTGIVVALINRKYRPAVYHRIGRTEI